ncbi:MAG: HAD-IB family hydrolase [Sphingomonas sp.]|nr:HAD-IB family hydrolase [Sphingomonas sp.]
MRHLAIYDMDRTITREPTWTPFLIHAARRIAPWRLALIPAALGGAITYKLGLISRGQLKQFTQRLILGRSLAPDTRAQLAAAFAETVDESGILQGARDRIAEDRAAGYELVLATASYRFYASAIADKLGFDSVIATESRFAEDGDLLPKIEGENCYGEAKLTMIKAWMAHQGIDRGNAHIRFYSDHVSDAPALEWADEGFAANPHDALRRLAGKRGWPVLDWRG